MADTLYQFDIDDDSPEIAYYPFVNLEPSSNITAGWQLLYTGSGAATNPGQVGVGTSYHYTTLNGASLLIIWNGTGIDLLGSANNASYNISLDGMPSSTYSADPANSLLASFGGFQNANHMLLLTTIITDMPSPDTYFIFDKARIAYAPPVGIVNTTAIGQVLGDTDIAFKGQWSYVADSTGNSLHMSNSAGDRAEAHFIGSAVTIYGLTSSFSGNFTVTLDNITTYLSARSSYNDSDTLLFYATDLSQDMNHHLTVTNQENRTLALNVGGINVTSFGNQTVRVTTSSSSNYTPAGTIAAAVLAAVLFLVLVGIFYYACFVRRKARSINHQTLVLAGQNQCHEKGGASAEQATNISPPSGEELESASLSTSKGYGFGLGLRRGFLFTSRKSKLGSNSSTRSRDVTGAQAESYPMTTQWDRDEKRFSASTLTDDFQVLARAPESEKLAPGWSNPVARTPYSFRYGRSYKNTRGISLPEILVEQVDPPADYDDDADVKTLTSRQDETLAATLSLSPRTSEALLVSDRTMLAKLGFNVQGGRSHENQQSNFLQVRDTSPFKVDMSPIFGNRRGNRDSRWTSESGGSTWSKVRARLYRRAHRDDGRLSDYMDRQETSGSSGPESVPVVMHESGSARPPSETAPGSGTFSFLDLTASRVSLRQHSKTTVSSAPAELGHGTRDASAWSETTSVRMQGAELVRDDVTPKPDAPSTASGDSSDNSGTKTAPSATTTRTQRSSPFPFPITIPLPTHTAIPDNDHVPERHITPSPPHSPKPNQSLQVPQVTPPELALIPADSPTESVPFSASEIHFRHSFSSYAGFDSRRASEASVLPPHPPLPRRDGPPRSSPAYSPPPPYIVQRVLGLPISPLSPLTPNTSPVSPTGTIPGPRRPGTAPTQLAPFRVGSLLGPRPRPSTAESIRGSAAPQLPMQGGRSSMRGPR